MASLERVSVDAGAVVHFVGTRVGIFTCDSGENLEADRSMENSPGFLFDALVLPDGNDAVQSLTGNERTQDFVKDIFRHRKAILAVGAGAELLDMAGLGVSIKEAPGVLIAESSDASEAASRFIDAVVAHRHLSRGRYPLMG